MKFWYGLALSVYRDPGTDIPDSLPRNTRVGSLPRKIGTVNHIRSAPERGLPFWVGPSEPCIKTGARWAEPKWGTSSLVFILQLVQSSEGGSTVRLCLRSHQLVGSPEPWWEVVRWPKPPYSRLKIWQMPCSVVVGRGSG